jgi:carboxypeptidase Q
MALASITAMPLLHVSVLTVLLAAPPVPEIEATAVRLREQALTTDHAYELTRQLTFEVGPRLAGSEGDRRALSWGERALARAGLDGVRREAVTVPRWERGEAAAYLTGPYPQPLVLAALGGSVGTPEEGMEAEVVRFASLAALASASADAVKGRIAFIDHQMRRTRDFSGYREAQPARTKGAAAAARLGAVAILIRSVGTSTTRLPHTGRVIYEPGTAPIPAAALASPDADLLADRLAAAAGGAEAVRVSLRLTCRMLPDAESANLVAEVRGRELPEEIVLLGAHLDSWDLGPGALDDAAGMGIVVTAARLLAELPRPPRRTVRVVLYGNEEFGLSGAHAYAERHRDELPRHVLAMEADHGSDRVYEMAGQFPAASATAMDLLARLLAGGSAGAQ